VSAESLFRRERIEELHLRLRKLQPDSNRQWGKMTPAQMLAHCSAGMQMAAGEIRPPRALIGRIIGPAIKRVALRDEEPMRRNSPTAKELLTPGEYDFAAERTAEQTDRLLRCSRPFGLYQSPARVFRPSERRRMGNPDVQTSRPPSPPIWRVICVRDVRAWLRAYSHPSAARDEMSASSREAEA
jgi:hypothetical protein